MPHRDAPPAMPRGLAGATIVFDLDGTLVDTAPDLAAATNHVLALKNLSPVPLAAIHPLIGHGSRAMIEAGLAIHACTVGDAELTRLHDAFLEYYAAHVAVGSRPFEGVLDVMDALAGRGALLAVCTNKVEQLSKLLLQTLGIAERFACIAGRDTFSACKPSPVHLLSAIEAAGGDARRAVMVGDSEVDIATARAAGIPCIAVTFGYTPTPVRELGPDIVIDHYREFLPALETILRPRSQGPA